MRDPSRCLWAVLGGAVTGAMAGAAAIGPAGGGVTGAFGGGIVGACGGGILAYGTADACGTPPPPAAEKLSGVQVRVSVTQSRVSVDVKRAMLAWFVVALGTVQLLTKQPLFPLDPKALLSGVGVKFEIWKVEGLTFWILGTVLQLVWGIPVMASRITQKSRPS